uniref:Uncharacterized protein n=1 Tax=Caenorhabditis japonica TaxID=281687 RepID=A0A8R1I978_CAEJA
MRIYDRKSSESRDSQRKLQCFTTGQETLINIVAGLKEKHAVAEDIVRQQAEVEGCLDTLSKHQRMDRRRTTTGSMIGVEAQAPSPRSERFGEHFIYEEQGDLNEHGSVASNTVQEQLNLSRNARPAEQHGQSLHEELLRVKLAAVEQQQKNLKKEKDEFEKQKAREKAELDKQKANLVQFKARELKTEDSGTDNEQRSKSRKSRAQHRDQNEYRSNEKKKGERKIKTSIPFTTDDSQFGASSDDYGTDYEASVYDTAKES